MPTQAEKKAKALRKIARAERRRKKAARKARKAARLVKRERKAKSKAERRTEGWYKKKIKDQRERRGGLSQQETRMEALRKYYARTGAPPTRVRQVQKDVWFALGTSNTPRTSEKETRHFRGTTRPHPYEDFF